MVKTIDVRMNTIMTILLAMLFVMLLFILRDVLLLLFLAVVLSTALNPILNWMSAHHIHRRLSIWILGLIMVAIVTIIITTFVPVVAAQFHDLFNSLISLFDRWATGQNWWSTMFLKGLTSAIPHLPDFVTSAGSALFRGALGGVASIIILGLLVYYLVVDPNGFRRFVDRLTPRHAWSRTHAVLDELERRLGRWLRGQLTISLIIAIVVGTGLALMHIKYAIALGLIAGLTEFIPSIGPYIGMIPAALIGFSQSPWMAVAVFVFYYVVQQLDNNILAPKVLGQAVGLKPLVIIIALFTGASLLGLLGFAIAVPTCIIVDTIIRNIWSHRQPAHT